MSNFKPMLAGEAVLAQLRYPVLASPKYDGVRALRISSCFMSRNLKVIPNQHLQARFMIDDGFDGELIAGDPTSPDCYRRTVSTVMSENVSAEDVRFFVFDRFDTYDSEYLHRQIYIPNAEGVVRVPQFLIKNEPALLEYEAQVVAEGYEGIMVRDPKAPYKFGRSTTNEGYLLKFKRFRDDEAVVTGFEERMHNNNPLTKDALGYADRSSHKANMVPMNTLGALVVQWNGLEFRIGTGFDDATRVQIWTHRDFYVGKVAKFKYLPVGVKDLPRHPVFLGWRLED